MPTIQQPVFQKHLLSVNDYHRMGDAGIFRENERVELIEGEIIDMAPIGSNHSGTVNHLSNLIKDAVGSYAIVATQNPVQLDDHSEPEPDIALLKPRADFYCTAHPGPRDVLLIIEVADSSLAYDRDVKIPLYARHRIPEVWLVDLESTQLLIHQNPAAEGYQNVYPAKTLRSLSPRRLPNAAVNLEGLFRHL